MYLDGAAALFLIVQRRPSRALERSRVMRPVLPSPLIVLCALAAAICALGFASAAHAGQRAASPRHVAATRTTPQRDRAAALRASADWLAAYPVRSWGAVELPAPCAPLTGGRRSCPIAIVLRAWTGGRRVPWRCDARLVLPAPGGTGRPRRTSADCVRTAAPA